MAYVSRRPSVDFEPCSCLTTGGAITSYRRTQANERYEILTGHAYNKHCNGDHINTIKDSPRWSRSAPQRAVLHPARHHPGRAGDYQGAINDFDKAATLTGINADPHNLLAHTHMHTAFTQLNDGNVDVDNAGPTRELAQADPGIRFLRGHLPCLGLV